MNAQNDQLNTPLHEALNKGHLQISQQLVEHQANIRVRNKSESLLCTWQQVLKIIVIRWILCRCCWIMGQT